MNHVESWKHLHIHYTKVKVDNNLTGYDIFRQLNVRPRYSMVQYLHPSGAQRCPSNKPGTVGHEVRQVLTAGLTKTDWKPSNSSYEEKLREVLCNFNRMWLLSVNVVNTDSGCIGKNIPELDVTLCTDEGPMVTEQTLVEMFTIGNTVPKIVQISKAYQLLYRAYPYTSIGDRI